MKGCASVDIPDASAPEAVDRALLRLSVFAAGRTAPNPSVACVISSENGEIFIGGATEPPGHRHAEIVALDTLDRLAAENPPFVPPVPLTLSVTLEPCSRYGRTPPCVQRIGKYAEGSDFARSHGLFIKTIRIGAPDPSLNGGGFEALRQMGFQLEPLNSTELFKPFLIPFLANLRKRRPLYVTKVASDPDGVIGHKDRSISLTGDAGRILTMRLRAKCDGVLVGPGTIAIDRPSLDLRPPPIHGAVLFEEAPSSLSETADGRGIWFRSLFEPDSGWTSMEDPYKRKEFQPVRIFVLGRPFVGRELFFERQYALSSATGKEALFLSVRSMSAHWPGSTVIPDLDDTSFFREVSELLAGRGLHRVLLESGRGLLPVWLRALEAQDSLIHVKRETPLPGTTDAGWMRMQSRFDELEQLDSVAFSPQLNAAIYGTTSTDHGE